MRFALRHDSKALGTRCVDELYIGAREGDGLLECVAHEQSGSEVNRVRAAQAVPCEQVFDVAMYIVVDGDSAHAEPLGAEGGVCSLDAFSVGGHFALLSREGGRHLVVEDLGGDGAGGIVPERLDVGGAGFDEIPLHERGGVEVNDHVSLPAIFEDDFGSWLAADLHRRCFAG